MHRRVQHSKVHATIVAAGEAAGIGGIVHHIVITLHIVEVKGCLELSVFFSGVDTERVSFCSDL